MRRALPMLLLFAAACAAKSDAPDLNAERAAIRTADSAWLASATARNTEAALPFWTEDGRVYSPGQPPAVGQQGIRQMVNGLFTTPGTSVSWTTDSVVVAASGDMAYSWGTNEYVGPGANGAVDTLRGYGVVVWRKVDGKWRAAIDATIPAGPPPAPATPATPAAH